ncbi:LysR family transcriptional regulator [Paraburkholderia susongensis]|uniref:ModE molybdate transport repressor domain-containing protein n=1 Tax=Paraburkholderia susongensis TaxID=1515439 RepID=A0A1X7LP60_9BURK|nr:LysR family transcriptional regulator [Paraburkholderia susongensis]SMG55661.1 ModE molybdate transport repressor domain-containing protein [Paraburkholderia susongensis]
MREVSLSLTQTFFLVAREGTYSAAARLLNISYQSVANHVRRLEQMVGERLVIAQRGVKTIQLTARGNSLYQLLEPEFEVVLARLGSLIDKERPVLRVGMPQAIFYYLMPSVLKAFNALHPTVEVICYERDTALVDLIKQGKLDACVSERYFGDQVVPQHVICSYEPALVYPADWDGPSDEDSVSGWSSKRPFVTHEPGQLLRNIATDILTTDEGPPEVTISTSGSSSVMRCVEEGIGFSIIPSWCFSEGNSLVRMFRLPSAPKVPIYFGEALFLRTNPYVRSLHKLCAEAILGRIAELTGSPS